VSGFLGEMFGAVQAIQVANAEEHITAHLGKAGRAARLPGYPLVGEPPRARHPQQQHGYLRPGVILLLAGTAISKGTFTVGDFALFVSYLWFTTGSAIRAGHVLWGLQDPGGVDRAYAGPDPPGAAAEAGGTHPVYARGPTPACATHPRTEHDRLEALEVRGLTYGYNADIVGQVQDLPLRNIPLRDLPLRTHPPLPPHPTRDREVNFSLRRGRFRVITGRVGSGKSTLVRVLLGLLPRQAGEIAWNGEIVSDPAGFFRPRALRLHRAGAAPVQRYAAATTS